MSQDASHLSEDALPADEPSDSAEPAGGKRLSLQQLSDAFAGMMLAPGETSPASDEPAEEHTAGDEPVETAEDVAEPVHDEEGQVSPRTILEAMLFVGNADSTPLGSRQLAALMRGVGPREIDELVRQLNHDYATNNCPYEIVSEGAGYRLALRDSMAGVRNRFHGRVREARLSPVAIEVLAIVAYHQPVTGEEVNDARGRSSGGALSQLVRRQVLRIERASEKPRTVHYFTTDRFLDLFGMQTLEDLPRSHDLERA